MAFNPAQSRLFGVDLYLLEKWDAKSQLPDEQQGLAIVQEFLQAGYTERWGHDQRLQERNLFHVADLPEGDQAVLARARPWAHERSAVPFIWLRTCYAPGTDETWAAVWTKVLWRLEDEPQKIFNDSKRYDFGSDWRRIFTRVPQLLHPWGSRRNLKIYEEEKQEGLKESLEAERLAREDVEDADESWSEDGPYWPSLYSNYHAACQIGFIFIADEETLTAPHPKEATFLVVWYDPDGNVVRQYRLGAYDAQGLEALYCGSFPCEHTAWSLGVVGEQYDEDAPLGPPYELDEGDEADL
ncbi:hypothetical protein BJ166DRAFT_594237 [Pestalotiopsis sp. NC0098]|nr:hypothetical protein BJ166DRAFT_594237 [Pestalotiopsis sp. NC0098]